MTLRKIFFWMHLCAGAIAGVVVLIMSVTGVLLTYERQITAWADRGGLRAVSSPAGTARLPIESMLEKVRQTQNALPSTLTWRADPAAPMELGFGRQRTLFVDPSSGEVLGEGSRKARAFFHEVTDWHRWLATEGASRASGRAVTGASNLAFLFLVSSGFYLWWPRRWTWQNLKSVILFRGGLGGKARDFNWHNVIGFWCAAPLFCVVLTGVVMSYPWANDLLYRIAGSDPPPRTENRGGQASRKRERGPGSGPGPGPGAFAPPPADLKLDGLNPLCARAEQHVGGWRSISLRLPASERVPVTFTISQGEGPRPDQRSQLTLARRTGEVVRWEPFSSYNLGRRLRTWGRWVHTGEAAGLPGQTVAGIASLGAVFLVWTGLSLALRRFSAWLARRQSARIAEQENVNVGASRV